MVPVLPPADWDWGRQHACFTLPSSRLACMLASWPAVLYRASTLGLRSNMWPLGTEFLQASCWGVCNDMGLFKWAAGADSGTRRPPGH